MLAGQEVEVVAVVARRHDDGVVAATDEHRVAVGDDHDVVQAPVVGVEPLQRPALGRVDAVVVDLVEVDLDPRVVLVVRCGG
jgi:hypothetical protein